MVLDKNKEKLLLKTLSILDETDHKSHQVYTIGFKFNANNCSNNSIEEIIHFAKSTGLVRSYFDSEMIENIMLTPDGITYLKSENRPERFLLSIKMKLRLNLL